MKGSLVCGGLWLLDLVSDTFISLSYWLATLFLFSWSYFIPQWNSHWVSAGLGHALDRLMTFDEWDCYHLVLFCTNFCPFWFCYFRRICAGFGGGSWLQRVLLLLPPMESMVAEQVRCAVLSILSLGIIWMIRSCLRIGDACQMTFFASGEGSQCLPCPARTVLLSLHPSEEHSHPQTYLLLQVTLPLMDWIHWAGPKSCGYSGMATLHLSWQTWWPLRSLTLKENRVHGKMVSLMSAGLYFSKPFTISSNGRLIRDK